MEKKMRGSFKQDTWRGLERIQRAAGPGRVALALVLASVGLLQGCASGTPDRAHQTRIELPLVQGWYDGKIADYVTTDISDATMASAGNANYVPRLANLLPANQPSPNPHAAIARIYKFLNYTQPSVLPSVPAQLEADEQQVDDGYSPLWLLMGVTWQAGHTPRELRSEDEVLRAQAAGEVKVESMNIIVNCPVVRVGDRFLPLARLPSD